MELALETTGITKTFGSAKNAVHALQGVDIRVGTGEIFSLLGPNGAGKTTLIKCVLGVVFPTGGSGRVLGSPLGSVVAKERIGYLPESHKYPLHLTGEEVLTYFGKLSGISGSRLMDRKNETLRLVGMTDWRNTKVRKYSKGMMQRLGLAQALINDPALVMLDEPTDGVDPVGRKEIRDVLIELKRQGRTIFLNSHLLSEVEKVSDRVMIMDHGKVIREGTVEALTATRNHYDLRVSEEHLTSAQQLLGGALVTAKGGLLETEFANVQSMNQMIDTLRAQGVLIESIQPRRESLEDLFLSLIDSGTVSRQ